MDAAFDRAQAAYDAALPAFYDAPCADCGDVECSCEEADAYEDYRTHWEDFTDR
jgi:hypothetical protein